MLTMMPSPNIPVFLGMVHLQQANGERFPENPHAKRYINSPSTPRRVGAVWRGMVHMKVRSKQLLPKLLPTENI